MGVLVPTPAPQASRAGGIYPSIPRSPSQPHAPHPASSGAMGQAGPFQPPPADGGPPSLCLQLKSTTQTHSIPPTTIPGGPGLPLEEEEADWGRLLVLLMAKDCLDHPWVAKQLCFLYPFHLVCVCARAFNLFR